MFRTPLVALLIALPAFAAPVSAQEITGTITYADLNLATPAGVTALQARINSTIAALTAPEDYRDLKQLQQSAKLSAKMHAEAQAQFVHVLARNETGGGSAIALHE